MIRMAAFALTAAFLLGSSAVRAQSRGCVERKVGPVIDGVALGLMPAIPQVAGSWGVVVVPQMPSMGTECVSIVPPVRDILRGEPAPAGGLLRGDDGRADLLRDSPTGRPSGAVPSAR